MEHWPWYASYDPGYPRTIDVPERTLSGLLFERAAEYADETALVFSGTRMTYRDLLRQIERAADGMARMGVRRGDAVTLCLPNIPQAVIAFYAVNRLGAVANMIHPLSPAEELSAQIRVTDSDWLVILDAFLPKHEAMLKSSRVRRIVACSIPDFLPFLTGLAFRLTRGRKIRPVPRDERHLPWRDLLAEADPAGDRPVSKAEAAMAPDDCAVYLHSGGTTGSPKTIMLSSANLNALAVQGPAIVGLEHPRGLKMVTILPLFHGFGLCMGLHTMMVNGITAILVPQFSPEVLAKIVAKERPNFLAGVPTLLEGMIRSPALQKADLSCLKAVFCGGDSLPVEMKRRVDAFLASRGAGCSVREGYGLTETVTVCSVNPIGKNREGTVGLPLANLLMKVIDPGTLRELPPGQDGEFCVSGPTVMLGYLKDPEATAVAVRTHEDGRPWVHTGDYGFMDEDGFFHFRQRIKRIIKVSGIPVFPSQVEEVLADFPGIRMACAIGVPHPYRMSEVKAFVVLDAGVEGSEALKASIREHCARFLLKYAVPVEIEFRDDLPRTKVGKVDFTALEREELARRDAG